jgi:hypothetical protein
MNPQTLEAVSRLREAVVDRRRGTKGFRPGKKYGHRSTGSLVEVSPADMVLACDAVPPPAEGEKASQVVLDLRMGSATHLEHREISGDQREAYVLVEADDVHHLLDLIPKG